MMIQKYINIKVALPLLCLLNLGLSASDPGSAWRLNDLDDGDFIKVLNSTGTYRDDDNLEIQIPGGIIKVQVPSTFKVEGRSDSPVYDRDKVFTALMEQGIISSDCIHRVFVLYYGDHCIASNEHFYNDQPLRLSCEPVSGRKAADWSDIMKASIGDLYNVFNIKDTKTQKTISLMVEPRIPITRLNQKKELEKVLIFSKPHLTKALLGAGLIAHRDLYSLSTDFRIHELLSHYQLKACHKVLLTMF